MDELGRKLHRSCQAIDHLHAMQAHLTASRRDTVDRGNTFSLTACQESGWVCNATCTALIVVLSESQKRRIIEIQAWCLLSTETLTLAAFLPHTPQCTPRACTNLRARAASSSGAFELGTGRSMRSSTADASAGQFSTREGRCCATKKAPAGMHYQYQGKHGGKQLSSSAICCSGWQCHPCVPGAQASISS